MSKLVLLLASIRRNYSYYYYYYMRCLISADYVCSPRRARCEEMIDTVVDRT